MLYVYGIKYNFISYISSPTEIKNIILATGNLGILVFILIQISQVVCVPIPSVIIVLVGTLIYGPTLCAVFCSIGVLIGSYLSFIIGRTFGKKFVGWVIGKQKLDYFINLINGKEKIFLIIAFIFPFFPDDILCMVSGVTNLSFKDFFKIATCTRPLGVFILCYFGGSFFAKNNIVLILILVIVTIILGIAITYFIKQRKNSKVINEIKSLVKGLRLK